MQTKDCAFRVKSLDDGAQGSFVGYGSTYNNTDLGGDVVAPGAFTKTLQSSGGTIPLLWQHDSREPVGTVKATDSEYGLKVAGQLLMELPVAQKAHALLKSGIIRGMSIGYDTIRSTDTPDGGRLLQELKLWELSLVTFPMNEAATVLGVKSLGDVESILRGIRDAGDPEVKAHLRKIAAECKRLLPADVDDAERRAIAELAAKIRSYVVVQ
ncbi:HK97 family phage prohead protease [Acidobacterium sp. S8]|uniref:HK97 family phage prohead protease n=1 Tax=Acidobacterium sp. S8 TaxID=1641854 RepID=UPI00131E8465|nr:HK97 family phage prohead protease [Acidobacterium sp. S8]